MPDLVDLIITVASEEGALPELAEQLGKAAQLCGSEAGDIAGLQPGQSKTLLKSVPRERAESLSGQLYALGFQCRLITSISEDELSLFEDLDSLALEQPIVETVEVEEAPPEPTESVSFDDDFAELGDAPAPEESAEPVASAPVSDETAPSTATDVSPADPPAADVVVDDSIDSASTKDAAEPLAEAAVPDTAIEPETPPPPAADSGADMSLIDELAAAMAGCDAPPPKSTPIAAETPTATAAAGNPDSAASPEALKDSAPQAPIAGTAIEAGGGDAGTAIDDTGTVIDTGDTGTAIVAELQPADSAASVDAGDAETPVARTPTNAAIDAGTPTNAAIDAGTPTDDTGTPTDAATPTDDAGTATDAGTPIDSDSLLADTGTTTLSTGGTSTDSNPPAAPVEQADLQMAIVDDEPAEPRAPAVGKSSADVASLVAGSVSLESSELAGVTLSPLEDSTEAAAVDPPSHEEPTEQAGLALDAPEPQAAEPDPQPVLEAEPELSLPAEPQPDPVHVESEPVEPEHTEPAPSEPSSDESPLDAELPADIDEVAVAANSPQGSADDEVPNAAASAADVSVRPDIPLVQSEEEALRRGREEIAQIKNRLDADKEEEDVVARQFQLKRRATEPKVLVAAGAFALLAIGIGGWMSMGFLQPPAPAVDIQRQAQIVANRVKETPENDPVFKLAMQRTRASDSALGMEVTTLLEKVAPVVKPDTLAQLLARYQLEPIAAAALPAAKTSSNDAAQSPADYLDSWMQRQALLKHYLELLARLQAEQGVEFAAFVVQDTNDRWLRLMGRHQLMLAMHYAGDERSVQHQLEQASREAYAIQAPAERVIAIADTALVESTIGLDELAEDSFLEASILGGTLVEAAERVVANATIASLMYRAGDLHGATSHFNYAQLAVASLDEGVSRDLGRLQLAENMAAAGFSGQALAALEKIDDPYIAVPATLAVASVFRRMGDQNSVRSAVVLAHRLGAAIVKPVHRELLLARVNATLNQ